MNSSSKAGFSTNWSATRASPESHVTRSVSMISRSGCQIGSSCHVCRALLPNSGWVATKITQVPVRPLRGQFLLAAPCLSGSRSGGGARLERTDCLVVAVAQSVFEGWHRIGNHFGTGPARRAGICAADGAGLECTDRLVVAAPQSVFERAPNGVERGYGRFVDCRGGRVMALRLRVRIVSPAGRVRSTFRFLFGCATLSILKR
jgi:hypothetical protein